MPFFQGASDFEINGGYFQDIRGNQYNKTTDKSFKIEGNDNNTKIAPNHSQVDNRAYYQGSGAQKGPMYSQPSTYTGYGPQTPQVPAAAPPPVDDQDPMLSKLKALYRLHWSLASRCHAAILAYQTGQQPPPQDLLDHAERVLLLSQQPPAPQYSQYPQQSQQASALPRTSSAPPFPQQQQGGEETAGLATITEGLQRQHIHNPFEHMATSASMSATMTSQQYHSTRG